MEAEPALGTGAGVHWDGDGRSYRMRLTDRQIKADLLGYA